MPHEDDDSPSRRATRAFGAATIGLLIADPFVHGAVQAACLSATAGCAVSALGAWAHADRRWALWPGSRELPARDYDGLPQVLLLKRLKRATRRVRIVDAVCGIATDPENGPRMFAILGSRLAERRDLVLECAFLCPLSPAMKERAKRLNRTESEQERIAEGTLGLFESFAARLPSDQRARVRITLYKEPPSYASYLVDDTNLVAALVGEQRSQDAPYTNMAASAHASRQCDQDYAEIVRSGLPLAEHRAGVLVAVRGGSADRTIEGVRFVRHHGELYVAVTDRDDRAYVDRCDAAVWRHCGEESTWAPKHVDPAAYDQLQSELDERWEAKYRTTERHPFFRLGTVP